MVNLTPVQGDPFAAQGGTRLTPVPGNPFAAAPLAGERTFRNDPDEDLYRQELSTITAERSKPRVPMSGVEELPPAEEAKRRVIDRRGKEAEQSEFDASRTPLSRAAGTAAFVASAPVRALTQGQYGVGDVAGLVSKDAGEAARGAEGDFARANESWLEPVAMAGEATLAIPGLQSMGAVPGQMLRAGAQTAGQVARRVPVVNRLLSAAPNVPSVATPAQAYAPAQRIADSAAFAQEGIPQFAPAFGSKGLARTARTIEEAPLVGGTVKVPKIAVEQAMAARQADIAQNAGAAASAEDVGLISQRGLKRFRGADLEDLDRNTVQGLGINPSRPPLRASGAVDVTKPSRLDTSTMTDRQLDIAAQSKVNLPGSTRTTIDDLAPAEIDRIVALPARDTSFATKASALYKQAEDAVPAMMKVNNRANPGLMATRNAGGIASGLMRAEKSASISGGVLEGRFGDLVQRLASPSSNFTLDSLRASRTEVGRALSNFGEFDARLDRTQLKQLYAGISDDYQSGLVALAARARKSSRLAPTDANYVMPSVADAADKALQRYRVADRYYRQGIERMDRFMQVLGADTLEQASRKIGGYLKENTQNIRALESMATSLRPEEWRSVLGNVVEGLGRLTPGAREAERVFSFERFATDWNKISQNPRTVALFEKSFGAPVVQSLRNLGRIAERMKYFETTKNYSGSAYTAGAGAGLATIFVPQAWPLLIASVAGTGVAGKVLTSQWFARWVNSLNRAQIGVGSSIAATRQAARPHLQRLVSLAKREPDPEVAAAMGALSIAIDQQLQDAQANR